MAKKKNKKDKIAYGIDPNQDIEPIDTERCQTEIKAGAFQLGTHPPRQCENTPDYLVVERTPNEEGSQGAMSVCSEHMPYLFDHVLPEDVLVFALKPRAEQGEKA